MVVHYCEGLAAGLPQRWRQGQQGQQGQEIGGTHFNAVHLPSCLTLLPDLSRSFSVDAVSLRALKLTVVRLRNFPTEAGRAIYSDR